MYVKDNKVYDVDARSQRVTLKDGYDCDEIWWQKFAIDFKNFKAKLLEAIGAVDDPFAWEKGSLDTGRGFIRLGSHRDLARLKLKIPKKGSRRKP